jgi:hypothetical protein
VHRAKEPYISDVAVNLSGKESASLTWKGTPPTDAPGVDSFTVSTGKGYDDIDPKQCTRTCCSGADAQCAAPWNEPKKVGACCTPIGTFYTGRPRPEQNGWKYWTPVEPLHTAYGRGIALHQHDTVTGEAIGHGCIRMEEENAHRIYLYSRGRETSVTISGKATVSCPATSQCSGSGSGQQGTQEFGGEPNTATAALTQPDSEEPGSGGGGGAPEPAVPMTEEAGA